MMYLLEYCIGDNAKKFRGTMAECLAFFRTQTSAINWKHEVWLSDDGGIHTRESYRLNRDGTITSNQLPVCEEPEEESQEESEEVSDYSYELRSEAFARGGMQAVNDMYCSHDCDEEDSWDSFR